MKSVRKRIFLLASLMILAVVGGGWAMMDHMDRKGLQFFETGAAIVGQLRQVAGAIEKRDTAGLKLYYADGYRGDKLGLTSLAPSVAREGVEQIRFQGGMGQPDQDRDAALAEWRAYLDSFESIEVAELHLHRLTEWESASHWTTSVRLDRKSTRLNSSHT